MARINTLVLFILERKYCFTIKYDLNYIKDLNIKQKGLKNQLEEADKGQIRGNSGIKKKKAVNDNNTQLDLLIERKKNQWVRTTEE